MSWFVYIARCGDGSLYTGVARDVARRLAQHNTGRGAKYTRSRAPVTLYYVEQCGDRGGALRREAEIRRLSRRRKLALGVDGEITAPGTQFTDAQTKGPLSPSGGEITTPGTTEGPAPKSRYTGTPLPREAPANELLLPGRGTGRGKKQ